MTLGSLESSSSNPQIPTKYKTVQNESKHTVRFRGEADPLSNLYNMNTEMDIFTQKFHSSEAAYQYCGALYARDFDAANRIVHIC